MKINYQIMGETQKNKRGKYVPDFEKLKQTAITEEERQYIAELLRRYEKCEERGIYLEFAYNMVYITKLKCGHYEIFQCPMNKYYSLEMNLSMAAEYAEKNRCTACICGR